MVAVFSRTSWHVTARLCFLRRLCARMLTILIPLGAKPAHFKPFSLRHLQILFGMTLWERHRQVFRHSQHGNKNDVPPAHWSRQTARMPSPERLRSRLPGQFQGGLLLVLSQHRGVPRYVEWYWREHIYKIVSTHIIVSNKYICSILLRCNKSAFMSSIL